MSAEARPEPTPFEPGSGDLPPALDRALSDAATSILLLVAADTGEHSIRTAIRVAEARAAAGHRTLLADASVREPRLHQLLQVENLEGLADVFLFGASLDRVRTRPPGRDFDFIPVGPYVPEPGALLESARWERLAAGLEGEDAKILVFVPGDTPGLGLLSKRAGEAILIGDPARVDRAEARLDPSCRVLAIVPPAAAAEGAAVPVASAGGGTAAAPDEPHAPVEADAMAEAGTEPLPPEGAGGPGVPEEPELTEPVIFRSQRESRPAVSPILLLLLFAALLAAAWFAYERYWGARAEVPAVEPAPEAPAEPVRGDRVETPIPVSVAVEAHQDLESALQRLALLRQSEPDIRFYLAPVAVQDVLYFRLLAGPVEDREAGERLMARLVEEQHKTASDPWAVRPTEHAFHLGEFDTLQEARSRVRSLAGSDIPAYVVPIAHEVGPDRYRVYGGAYESPAEAEVMQGMLEEAGVEATLVPRTGRPIDVAAGGGGP